MHETDELKDLIGQVLETAINPLKSHAWRGQADIAWTPYPTLYRRLLNNHYSTDKIDENLIQQYETDLLCESNGIGFYQGNPLNTLVKLQHHGGATRLLDVTRDPFIAFWFCSQESNGISDGCIIHYSIDLDFVANSESMDSWREVVDSYNSGRPILFYPKIIDDRIKSQSSAFLTTVLNKPLSSGSIFTDQRDGIESEVIRVPSYLKSDIQNYLLKSRGLRYFDIFPDFDGYATYCSQKMPFPRAKGELYDAANGLFPPRWTKR